MYRDVMNQSGIFMTAKRRADLVKLNAKIMSESLIPSSDFVTGIKMAKRNRKIREFLDVEEEELK